MADYKCPHDCGGRIVDVGVANAFRCRRCGQRVLEAVDERYQNVKRFYRQACGETWGGMSA